MPYITNNIYIFKSIKKLFDLKYFKIYLLDILKATKHCRKKLKKTQIKKSSHVEGLENYCYDVNITQSSLQTQCNCYQNINAHFLRNRKFILKFI